MCVSGAAQQAHACVSQAHNTQRADVIIPLLGSRVRAPPPGKLMAPVFEQLAKTHEDVKARTRAACGCARVAAPSMLRALTHHARATERQHALRVASS
jgi:hypothetical protein